MGSPIGVLIGDHKVRLIDTKHNLKNMGKIEKAYDYTFYTFYRFWEKAPSKWWSEWKSILTISFFSIFILLSFYGLILYHYKLDLFPKSKLSPIVLGILIYFFNYYYFLYKRKWEQKIERFNELSKVKDRFGILLIVIISVMVLASFIYSIYLVSTVDWQNLQEPI